MNPRPDRSVGRLWIAAVIAALLIAATGLSYSYLGRTTNKTATKGSPSADCLIPVGAGANIRASTGNTTTGVTVTLPSGQTTFFPQNQCPQPVSDQTFLYSTVFGQKIFTDYYKLALDAVSNPRFVSLANGTTFLFSQPDSMMLSTTSNGNGAYEYVNGSYQYNFSLYFFQYSNTVLPCLGHFDVTAGIEADFFAPYVWHYSNSVPTQGNWNLTDISVNPVSSIDLAAFEDSCIVM